VKRLSSGAANSSSCRAGLRGAAGAGAASAAGWRADWARVSVLADSAGWADALSTGFSLAPASAIRAALPGLPGVEVRVLDDAGQEFRFT
jgi:hypothetical protein